MSMLWNGPRPRGCRGASLSLDRREHPMPNMPDGAAGRQATIRSYILARKTPLGVVFDKPKKCAL